MGALCSKIATIFTITVESCEVRHILKTHFTQGWDLLGDPLVITLSLLAAILSGTLSNCSQRLSTDDKNHSHAARLMLNIHTPLSSLARSLIFCLSHYQFLTLCIQTAKAHLHILI